MVWKQVLPQLHLCYGSNNCCHQLICINNMCYHNHSICYENRCCYHSTSVLETGVATTCCGRETTGSYFTTTLILHYGNYVLTSQLVCYKNTCCHIAWLKKTTGGATTTYFFKLATAITALEILEIKGTVKWS